LRRLSLKLTNNNDSINPSKVTLWNQYTNITKYLTNLTELRVPTPIPLNNLPNITKITMADYYCTRMDHPTNILYRNKNMIQLPDLKNLEQLIIECDRFCDLDQNYIEVISQLCMLKKLVLHFKNWNPMADIYTLSLQPFTSLLNLEYLAFKGQSLHSIRFLEFMPNLHTVYMMVRTLQDYSFTLKHVTTFLCYFDIKDIQISLASCESVETLLLDFEGRNPVRDSILLQREILPKMLSLKSLTLFCNHPPSYLFNNIGVPFTFQRHFYHPDLDDYVPPPVDGDPISYESSNEDCNEVEEVVTDDDHMPFKYKDYHWYR